MEDSSKKNSNPNDNQPSTSRSKSKTLFYQCKICGASALHSNYGAITCYSCKMFFKRHVTIIRKSLTCNFDGQCEINIHTRHTCSACRLEKCYANGMQAELIRCPLSRQTSKTHTTTTELISPTSNILNLTTTESNQLQLLPITNILQSNDDPILTAEQWTLINNLIYSYDERKLISIARKFFDEIETINHEIIANEFFMKIYEITGVYIRSNSDFCTLLSDDRSTFLRNLAENINCLGTIFTWAQSKIYQSQSFIRIFLNNYGQNLFDLFQRILKFIDSDIITAKLTLSIFAFSNHMSIFSSQQTNESLNSLAIARIQNIYTEITWKYLLHRYNNDQQSIECFNKLIQCLLAATTTISYMQNLPKHLHDMKTLIEKTELLFIFDDVEYIDEN